jgi:ATP-dependent helicase/nuclease subunit A
VSGNGITIVGASAGSGKTYRLTQDVTAALEPGKDDRVPVEGLFAVTYTKKAQAELAARIRHKLVSDGAFDEALRLPLAYLGTVHAACLRLLQEFALDAGLSPSVDVVAGDETKLLRQALEAFLPSALRERIDKLARRLQLRIDHRSKRHDWLTPVGDIMDLARGNRIRPEALPAMARRSVDRFLSLLMAPRPEGGIMDQALARELAGAEVALRKANDGTKVTQEAIDLIAGAKVRLQDGELDWCDWAKLSTIKVSQRCADAVAKLREAAAEYEAHPQLHAEISEITSAIFEAAQIGLTAYQAWKAERRVVDYVDMLDGALSLVDHPRVKGELADRLRFSVVDEFQDTSPIQLALFVKLHALTGRSLWVGDRKQCIFEYAGADPLLMDAVAGWVAESGGTRDLLPNNYRSRPELVGASSELFAAAMERHGFSREEVATTANRALTPELAIVPALGLWCLDSKNKEQDPDCIAAGVERLLQIPGATRVLDRASEEMRDLRPGDIAVLVATNEEAAELASALHTRGIRVAVARVGLLKTPEGTLVDAALRFTLDESDSLAASTIDALHGFGGQEPDAWLLDRVRRVPPDPSGWRRALSVVRTSLNLLSPSEALERTLAALDAVHLATRWPDSPQRLANLDALRGLALGYEERCAQGREAATVAGMLRYFDDMSTVRLRRDEEIASDDQHVPTDEGAVVVSTYHRAKGLEWPVVVLSSLYRKERRHAFEVCPETDRKGFNPSDPLADRWIRYWPWPLGTLTSQPLRDKAEHSEEGERVALREEKERARLLYVGFTRARDHLVLAVRATSQAKGKTTIKKDWLDDLVGLDGSPLVQLPTSAIDQSMEVTRIHASGAGNGMELSTRVWRLSPTRAQSNDKPRENPRWFARGRAPAEQPACFRIVPSNAVEDWPDLAIPKLGDVVQLSGCMPVSSKVAAYDALGDAVHAFLAADAPELVAGERGQIAQRLLSNAQLTGLVSVDALLAAGDRLRAFVKERWGEVSWHREVPIEALVDTAKGTRRVGGTVDLLLETSDGYVIVDHKTFPGTGEAALRKKTLEFLTQLAAYAAALDQVRCAKVVGCWVHFPVSGAMVEVSV